MHEIINKLFEKFHIELLEVPHNCVRIKMRGTGRVLWVTYEKKVCEVSDSKLATTPTSQWVEGILRGKIRNDKGELV